MVSAGNSTAVESQHNNAADHLHLHARIRTTSPLVMSDDLPVYPESKRHFHYAFVRINFDSLCVIKNNFKIATK